MCHFNVNTQLPTEIIQHFIHPTDVHNAGTYSLSDRRNSNISWLSASNWIVPWIQTYITTINQTYFQYDLTGIDAGNAQYTQYDEGQFYQWHIDAELQLMNDLIEPFFPGQGMNINTTVQLLANQNQYIRKLSFTLQLNDDYEGGELQLLYNHHDLVTTPKKCGMLTVFDSRIPHRVRKVKSGQRKSLVGWMVGPRWK